MPLMLLQAICINATSVQINIGQRHWFIGAHCDNGRKLHSDNPSAVSGLSPSMSQVVWHAHTRLPLTTRVSYFVQHI